MIQYFLPVWGSSRHLSMLKDVDIVHWWNEPPLHHGHGLISPVHWKRAYTFPAGCWIFGDSGGFTLRSPKINLQIDPVVILQWQASLCSVGCILDVPPLGLQKSQRDWFDRLDKSVAHSMRALPEYLKLRERGSAFRWWGVLHGNNAAEQDAYYRAVCDIYSFADAGEGWAVRAEPIVNTESVADTLRVLKGLGITRAHFLAATGQEVVAVLYALGPEAGLELVTYDSAYATKGGYNRLVLVPDPEDPIKWTTRRERGAEDFVRRYVYEECCCAACAWMRKRTEEEPRGQEAIRAWVFGGWWSTWCQLHNLCIQCECLNRQWWVAQKEGRAFLPRVLGRDAHRICRIFDGQEPRSIIPATGSSQSLLNFT